MSTLETGRHSQDSKPIAPYFPPRVMPLGSSSHAIFRLLCEPKLNMKLIKSTISSDGSCLEVLRIEDSYTPLHAAARRGVTCLVRLLVESGCFLDAQAVHGQTPFLIACQVS